MGFHGGGGSDYWVVKLNDTGVIQWSKCYGGTNDDAAKSIIQCSDSGYIVVGYSKSNDGDVSGGHGLLDYWVVKLNDTGAIQWSKCYGGSLIDFALSVLQTPDAGYIIAGEAVSNDGDVTGNHGSSGNYWIVKIDTTGTIQWEKCYGGSIGEEAESILQTSDGGYIVAGTTISNDGDVTGNHGAADYWVVKLSDTGAIQWEKCYGGSQGEAATSMVRTNDGNYAIAGYYSSNDGNLTGNYGYEDYWIIKIDTNGNLLWQKNMGGSSTDQAFSLIQTSYNDYVICGESVSNNGNVTGNHGNYDCWIVKLGGNVGIDEIVNGENGVVVYPNPASSTLTIRNLSPALAGGNGELVITDVLGNTVYQQVINQQSSVINISELSDSMYFYRITSAKETLQGKFVKQ